MFKECHKQNADIEDTDVKWVLTVPAIWTDPAKGFMRAAAIKVRRFFDKNTPDKRNTDIIQFSHWPLRVLIHFLECIIQELR